MTLHETCVEHFRRRLGEGWRCISLNGYNAVLISPDGSLRCEIDLRDDVEAIQPNAVGDETALSPFPGTGEENWEDVRTDDGNTSYVYTNSTSFLRDLYNLRDHTAGSGLIDHITVYVKCRSTDAAYYYFAKPAIKSGATVSVGSQSAFPGIGWHLTSHSWSTNPDTGKPFTWDEIDSLQAGLELRIQNVAAEARCTVLYVNVYYEPGWLGKVSGVTNPAKVMGIAKANIAKVKGVASV